MYWFNQRLKQYIVNNNQLKLFQIDFELLRRGVDTAHLVDRLDALRAEAEPDGAVQVLAEEAFPLQVNLLDLFVAGVTERHDAGLSVRLLPQQVAFPRPHHEVAVSASTALRLFATKGIPLQPSRGREVPAQ